jgi:hypothetical protein
MIVFPSEYLSSSAISRNLYIFFIQLIREIPGEIPVDFGSQLLPAGVEAGGGGAGGGVEAVQVILFEDNKARGTGGRRVCVCTCVCVYVCECVCVCV